MKHNYIIVRKRTGDCSNVFVVSLERRSIQIIGTSNTLPPSLSLPPVLITKQTTPIPSNATLVCFNSKFAFTCMLHVSACN